MTFTQLKFPLEIHYDNMEEVFRILREIAASGSGNVINAEVQLHVTGENVDMLPAFLDQLEDQHVLSNYKRNEMLNNIESFKRLYLK